jgi:hypothetical protein
MAVTQADTDERAGPAAGERRGSFRRFLAWLLLPSVMLYLLVFALVLVPAVRFERWGPTKWGPVLQFAFDANQNADVLVFGDSSAFLGLDPRVVEAELHATAVVLPNTIGSLPITGEMALRRYLARNRPPRLLVLYFTAWDLNYGKTANTRVFFEGEEMLLHNGSAAEILVFVRQHPLEFLAFPFRFNSTLGTHLLGTFLRHEDRERQTAEALGHVDYTEPYPVLRAPCALPEALVTENGEDSLRSLVERYSTMGTKVVVYLAPIPGCAGAEAIRAAATARERTPPVILPAEMFASDGLFAHPEPGAVRTTSELFAEFLRGRMPAGAEAGAARPVVPKS